MRIILLIILFIYSFNIFSQQVNNTLKGKVTDKNNQPLESVNITIEDLSISASTDKNGAFEISNIPHGKHTLSLELTGYETKTIELSFTDKSSSFDFTLKESNFETPTIEVTGTFSPTKVSETPLSVTSLESRTLSEDKSQTLAQTISKIPGVNNISTGTGIGKPVIRGLSSQAVITVNDGVKQESQQWGDEHGPEITLFDLDKIEIIRGPVSLIYGSDGIGGVINVVSKQLKFSNKKSPLFYGEFNAGGFSVNKEGFGNLTLAMGTKNIGFKGHYEYRKSGDTKTPDGSFIISTISGTKIIYGGTLFNSGSTESEGGLNLAFKGNFVIINAGFRTTLRNLQIHEDPVEAPSSTSNQDVKTSEYVIDGLFTLNKKFKLEPQFSFQTNLRKEFGSIADKEKDLAVLNLDLKTFQGNIKLHHDLSDKITGTSGLSLTSQKNNSTGEEKLIPEYRSYNIGAFIMEKYTGKNYSASLGGRFDTKKLNIDRTVFEYDSLNNPSKVVNAQSISFNAFSGSAGFVYNPIKELDLFTNIGRGWRPPSEFELFVDGEHEGAGRYEAGLRTQHPNDVPKPELSFNIDAGIRMKYKKLNAEFTLFRNRIDNFIYPSPTGNYFVQTDPGTGDTLKVLPIFNMKQAQSTLTGFEYNVQVNPVNWLLLSVSGDYVYTKNNVTGSPLPFTPPMKNIIELKVQKNKIGGLINPYFRVNTRLVSAQNRVDPLESRTEGYTLLNAGTGFEFSFAKSIASVDLSVDNLLDTKYVDHLSRYRNYALNPGRSYNLQVSLPFNMK